MLCREEFVYSFYTMKKRKCQHEDNGKKLCVLHDFGQIPLEKMCIVWYD